MSRAIDLGPVDAAAVKTAGGKIRLRLLLTADQLESMLMAARAADPPTSDAGVTQCDAPEKTQTRQEDDDEDDVREASSPVPPTAPIGRISDGPVFVIEGTRAWIAWLKVGHKASLSVRREHEGRVKSGWHFPTLFPPNTDDKSQPQRKAGAG